VCPPVRLKAREAFIDTAEEIHSLSVSQGDYKLDHSGEHYVYTWKGALRHSPSDVAGRAYSADPRGFGRNKARGRLGFRINPSWV